MLALLLILLFTVSSDSLSVFKTPDVVVTATRTAINPQESPAKVIDIDTGDLARLGIHDISEVLSITDGLFVNEYGPTQLSTISTRGTAAEETLFMVDGVRLNSVQNGLVDLSIVPASQIGHIEISEGGSSALFGSDAIGGIINLQTTSIASPSVGVGFGGGSYGYQEVQANAKEKIDAAYLDFSLQHTRGINDYDFNYNDGLNSFPMKRTGADFVMENQLAKVIIPDDKSVTSIVISNLSADRGTPGAVTGPLFVGTEREYDNDLFAVVNHRHQLGPLSISASAGFTYDYLRFVEPPQTEGAFGINDFYKMISFQPNFQMNYSSDVFDIASGVDMESDRGTSTEMTGTKYRTRAGVFASGVVNFVGPFSSEIHLSPSARMDWYSDFGNSFNPKIGINIKPIKLLPINFRASAGTNFRAPTFNELYYIGGGNANIKPEKSLNYDAGLIAEVGTPLNIVADMDFYSIDITDGIQWLPTSNGIWQPRDYRKILSQGIEFSLRSTYRDIAALQANYSLGKSIDLSDPGSPLYNKELIYRPQEQASILAIISPWIMTFSTTLRYASFRYTTPQNDEFLPGFATIDASASAKISAGELSFSPILSVKNIFNENYQVIPQYPLPLRTFYLDINIQFNQ